jgi:hypothetical protein
MANVNIIAGYFGGTGRNQILSQTLAATTETEFKVGVDSGATTTIAVLSMPTQTQILGSQSPLDQTANPALSNSGFSRLSYFGDSNPPFNSGVFDNSKPFLVRIAGVATPASNAGNTLAVILYLGATKSGTALATTAAVPQASTTTAKGFIMEAQLLWDSTSQAVTGQYWFSLPGTSGTVYSTWKTLAAAGSAVTSPAGLTFCASATWGNVAGGVVAVSEFSISQL